MDLGKKQRERELSPKQDPVPRRRTPQRPTPPPQQVPPVRRQPSRA